MVKNLVLKYGFCKKLIKTLETHFFTLSECVSNVLITGESNFDEKSAF